MHPVICMITDRRRHGADAEDALPDRVAAAAHAGVHLIHIRERDLEGRALTRLVERCVLAVRGTVARIVVNDRADVALASGAHGTHLRADSPPAPRVRAMMPGPFLLGRSVHSRDEAEQLDRSGGLDYILFGTVFESRSKPDVGAAGRDALAAVVSATTLPVLAVGGVTPRRVPEVARAGAAGMAAIGLFADCSVDALQRVVAQTIRAFDTAGTVP